MQKFGILRDDPAHGVNVIPPDCIDEIASLDQPRPTRRLVTSRKRELRISEFDGSARILREVRGHLVRVEGEARRFSWVDLTEVSTRAMGSTGWIAADDLHPGDAQYAAWAEEIWSNVRDSWSSVWGD